MNAEDHDARRFGPGQQRAAAGDDEAQAGGEAVGGCRRGEADDDARRQPERAAFQSLALDLFGP